ncbi:hypothetical protein HK098_005133 [Nowakowskiella sp. JEL0407]|nr:hypothetical protein HK098_005133 [Nowakowskiella sp. JEL0407]
MAENIIFISYRQSTCKAEAAYLHKSILAQDNTRTVFWDFASIPAGTKWKQCFLDNIGQASLVVLLVSKATIKTFEDSEDPDNLLLEWDIAVGRYLEGNLKILPVFFLDGDEKDFDFRGVQLHTTVADGCGRSFKEIWKEISQIQGIKVHFSHVHDMEALDIRISNLIPITTTTTLSQPALPAISESIDEPRIFIGREDVLEKLSLWFADTTKGAAVIFFGGPGIGKTTVATHFISICSDSLKYSHILLVSLVSEYTFQDTVIDCCKTVGIPLDDDFEKNKGAFFNWLKKNKSYLIVVDNADDKDITKKCFGKLSKFSGHVLITSRNPAIDQYIPLGVEINRKNRLEITIWPDEITRRYVNSRLESRLPKTDSEKDYLEKILKFLNGYPLIVEQMCSFMADDHGRSFEKYYELLDRRSQQIWDQEPEPATSRYQRTIDATFGIVIRHFQQTGNRAACIVLGAIGCVSNTSIPIDTYLRQYLVKAGIDVEIDSVISTLIKISLLQLDDSGKSVSIHLAIQDVIRRTLDSGEYLDTTFSNFGVTVLDKILPKKNKNRTFESSTISTGTALLPHIVELYSRSHKHDSELASLLFNAGDFANFIGSYEIAKRLFTLSIEIYSKLNGRDSQNVASAINYLGDIAKRQGDYAEAKKLYNESLDIKEKVYGTRQHAEIAVTINNLGDIAKRQGDYAEAKKLYNECLDIFEKVYGTRQHANIAVTFNNLGDIAKAQGDYAEAKKLYNESLEIKEKVYGTRQHANIAITINNLGDIAKKQGELDKALKLHLEALVIFKRIYETSHHADIAGIMFYIGETFEAMDDFEKAKLNYEQSLEIFKKVFGVDHDWCLVVSGALENLKLKKKDVEGLTAISSNLEVREKDSEMLQLSITEPEEEFSEAIESKGNVNVLDHVEAPVDVKRTPKTFFGRFFSKKKK